ncbi:serine/threonine-protein phosphatase 6 regulatory ankyrin repeat subunit B-like [Haliotis rufescens]|uniref:serine/threonine-protein phosphatase 6 regulatory ankyrin repeat subunit B-like n=1 Tax=Haliotis rufescens TaxID=6454 RepID=UPI00201F0475|nr:serine/threonine-protein phosphatase 6 regulatory ankyrin repeat subunit B-like [Haliotis rufescens]
MDSAVESDDSDLSSSYSSDDIVECSNSKYRRKHSPTRRPLEFSDFSFLAYLYRCDVEKGVIHPKDVELYLKKDILGAIKSIPPTEFIYVNSPLLTSLMPEEEVPAPDSVICDAYVFTKDRMIQVLTFVESDTTDALHYNSSLAQTLTCTVRREHGTNFHLVHGVIRPDEWKYCETFHKTLKCLQLNVEKYTLYNSLQYDAVLLDHTREMFFEMMLNQQLSERQREWTDLFVETAAYHEVRTKLQQNGLVILTGGHGEGKTTIGQKLCYDYQQEGYNTVTYSRKEDFNLEVLQATKPTLVVLDEIDRYTRGKFPRNRKNVHLVVIEERDKEERHWVPYLFEANEITVNITEIRNRNWERTKEEYSRMMQIQTDIPSETRDEIIAQLDPCYVGFPKVMKQFWKARPIADPVSYFTSPHSYFITEVEKLFANQDYSAGIMYVLISGNKVNLTHYYQESDSDPDDDDDDDDSDPDPDPGLYQLGHNATCICTKDYEYDFEAVDTNALRAIGTLFPKVVKQDLPDMIHKLNMTYLYQEGYTVCFNDPLTYDVCVYFADANFPGFLWKHCIAIFEGDDLESSNTRTIFISRTNNDKLLAQLIDRVRRGKFRYTFSHPVLTREDNIDRFFIGLGKDLKEVLDLREANQHPATTHSFLYWLLQSGNDYLCKKVLQKQELSQVHVTEALTSFLRLNHTKFFLYLWQNMLDRNNQLSFTDSDGNSLLMLAVMGNVKPIVKVLMDAGVDPLMRNNANDTALHLACVNGYTELAQVLLPHLGDGWNTKGKDSRTTVMMVAHHGNSHLYHYLTNDKKCDLTGVDDYGNTILHLACEGGCLVIVKHIISSSLFDIDTVGQYGKTPLMIAAFKGHRDVFQLLLSKSCHISPEHFSMTETLVCGHIDNSKDLTEFLQSREHGNRFKITHNINVAPPLSTCLDKKGSSMLLVDERGMSLLHTAADTGNMDLAAFLLSKGKVDINTRDAKGRTPVMLAATAGHHRMFDFLVGKNCDLSIKDQQSSGILHFASQGGNVFIIRTLTENDVNEENICGKTPLSYSAEKGHKQIFESFLDKGGDISVVDKDKNTLLHLASHGGNLPLVEDILAFHVVNINAVNSDSRTPLLMAAYSRHTDICQHLISAGADVDIRDNDGNDVVLVAAKTGNRELADHQLSLKKTGTFEGDIRGKTALMWAAERGDADMFHRLLTWWNISDMDVDKNNVLQYACIGGNADIVRSIVLQNKVSINSRGHNFETPVTLAAKKGHRRTFEVLVENGVDLTEETITRNNILHMACSGGSIEIVEYLLSDNKIDINSRDELARTPVMLTVEMGHRNLFDHLVSINCDMTLEDVLGDNILHMACREGHVEIVEDIIGQDILDINCRGQNRKTPVLLAAEMGHKRVFDLLIHKGCDPTVSDDKCDTILHKACYGGNADIIEYIVSHNIVNINSRNTLQRTPVMWAAEKGQKSVFDCLVRNKCDLNVQCDSGGNILHMACVGGHLDIIEYVVSHQIVSIDSSDHLGRTPVMLAAQNGHSNIFDLLVRGGCDLAVKDGYGETILHVACIGGNAEIVRYIVSCNVVDINSCGWCGRTPLDIAKHLTDETVIGVLESHGAMSNNNEDESVA